MPQPKTLSAELPQTGTFEGRSTDLAIAPWQEIERQKKKKKKPSARRDSNSRTHELESSG